MICKDLGFEAAVDWFGITPLDSILLSLNDFFENQIIRAFQCPNNSKKLDDCQYRRHAIDSEKTVKETPRILALMCTPMSGEIIKGIN